MHAHEVAAASFERMGDGTGSAIASRRAAAERIAYVHAATEHPEWSVDVSFGLMRGQRVGVRAPNMDLDRDR
jgi:hypothetical protein